MFNLRISGKRFNFGSKTLRSFCTKSFPRIEPKQLIHKLKTMEDAVLLDVRPTEEYKKYRIAGALNYSLDLLPTKAKKLPLQAPLFIHCDQSEHPEQTGTTPSLSLQAAKQLQDLGFQSINLVNGSVEDLRKVGFFYFKEELPIEIPTTEKK